MSSPARFLFDSLNPGTGWRELLIEEFRKPYMAQLASFLAAEDQAGKVIYPDRDHCFNALNTTPFDQVSVVILGQDPYHGPGQAHGLCFSVLPDVPPPPSLVNIFKEIHSDLGLPTPEHGCLLPWARQGVLLLNSVLTVEQGKAAAHQGKGWEQLTDHIIRILNERKQGLVFLLWGSYAIKKGALIDRQRHCVLESVHPSPLSAHRGFLGCRHFSKTNAYLQQENLASIDWSLPSKAEIKKQLN